MTVRERFQALFNGLLGLPPAADCRAGLRNGTWGQVASGRCLLYIPPLAQPEEDKS
jgi:hypothetical protein